MTTRRAWILIALLLAAACPGRGGGGAAEPVLPPTPEEVVTAIKARLEQYRQGYEVRSLEALEPLYAHSEALVVTHQGRTQRGWTAVREWLTGFLGATTTYKARLSDVRITALGDSGALAVAALHRSYGDGVKTVDEVGTLSLVFVRDGESWLIIDEHFSYAPVGE